MLLVQHELIGYNLRDSGSVQIIMFTMTKRKAEKTFGPNLRLIKQVDMDFNNIIWSATVLFLDIQYILHHLTHLF